MPLTPLPDFDPAELFPADVVIPPTQDELPSEDGVPMESERHRRQMELLIDALQPWLDRKRIGYVGGNMFLYYSLEQVRGKYVRGPDVFVALDVPQRERKSWVVWEESKAPDVVIELLSDSTKAFDKTGKKNIYQDQVRVPEYYWFDPFDPNDWAGFTLEDGAYQPLEPNGRGRLISRRLGLALVRWRGVYKGIEATWLRWEFLNGDLLLTDKEAAEQRAEQERQRAEQERQRAERERQRAGKLAARLRALGVDPDAVE